MTAPATETPRKKASNDKPLKWTDKLLIALVSLLGAWILRLLWLSLRKDIRGEENVAQFWRKGENVVVAFWHDRLILLPFAYRGKMGIRVLISSSRDGELIARTVKKIGLDTIRGSSTRGGGQALDALIDAARGGYDIGITPDGPKGPRHVAKAGVVEIARATRGPVIPLLFSSARGKRARSWDRFLIPMPFDRVVLRWGEPVWTNPDGDFEADRLRVEEALNKLCAQIDGETGNPE